MFSCSDLHIVHNNVQSLTIVSLGQSGYKILRPINDQQKPPKSLHLLVCRITDKTFVKNQLHRAGESTWTFGVWTAALATNSLNMVAS